jgi:hypothetical protein
MNTNWDAIIGYAIAFALGVALTILILGDGDEHENNRTNRTCP